MEEENREDNQVSDIDDNKNNAEEVLPLDANIDNEEDAELDTLLDSALEDFDQLPRKTQSYPDSTNLESPINSSSQKDARDSSGDGNAAMSAGEFIDSGAALEAEAEFKNAMQALMSDVSQTSPGDPKIQQQFEELVKAAQIPSRPAPAGESRDSEFTKTLGETLSRLAQSAEDIQEGGAASGEEFINQALKGIDLGEGDLDANMDFLPMMQEMMNNLLSKDVLYPSLKEIVENYPEWLDKNEGKVKKEDMDRYRAQFDMMNTLCQEYEENGDKQGEAKTIHTKRVTDLVQKLEQFGQPPEELVSNKLELGELGMPRIPGMPGMPGMPGVPGMGSNEECCIM